MSIDLMQPRIKVIADFWDNPFKVGDIIEFDIKREYYDTLTDEVLGSDWYTQGNDQFERQTYALRSFKEYPHLFKKLEWWEEREVADMPKFLKWNYMPNVDDKSMEGYVAKVKGWSQAFYGIETTTGEVTATKFWLPITEEEYNEYQSKHQAQ